MPSNRRNAGTPFVLVTLFLDTLGVGLLIPVAPRLIESFLGGSIRSASTYFGLIISLYSIMQFIFAPVLGGMSDRFGRRPVILVSLAGAAASYLTSGFAPSIVWLFVGRIVSGITGASFSAASAYIADTTPAEKRAQSFGMMGAVFGLGFILGPAVGGFLGDVNVRLPYFVAAGLNFLNLLYGYFVLPESLAIENRREFSLARANPFGALRGLARHPIVFGLTGAMMCGYLAQWIMQTTWALHTQARFGWNMRGVGLSLMAAGFAMAFVQGFLVRIIVPKIGERGALIAGIASTAVAYLALALADNGRTFMAFIGLLALGGIAGPAVQAMITREVGANEQGELQGSLNSLNGLAAVIAPLIGTSLISRYAVAGSSPRIPGIAFFASAGFSALALILALRVVGRFPRSPEKTSVEPANDAEP